MDNEAPPTKVPKPTSGEAGEKPQEEDGAEGEKAKESQDTESQLSPSLEEPGNIITLSTPASQLEGDQPEEEAEEDVFPAEGEEEMKSTEAEGGVSDINEIAVDHNRAGEERDDGAKLEEAEEHMDTADDNDEAVGIAISDEVPASVSERSNSEEVVKVDESIIEEEDAPSIIVDPAPMLDDGLANGGGLVCLAEKDAMDVDAGGEHVVGVEENDQQPVTAVVHDHSYCSQDDASHLTTVEGVASSIPLQLYDSNRTKLSSANNDHTYCSSSAVEMEPRPTVDTSSQNLDVDPASQTVESQELFSVDQNNATLHNHPPTNQITALSNEAHSSQLSATAAHTEPNCANTLEDDHRTTPTSIQDLISNFNISDTGILDRASLDELSSLHRQLLVLLQQVSHQFCLRATQLKERHT